MNWGDWHLRQGFRRSENKNKNKKHTLPWAVKGEENLEERTYCCSLRLRFLFPLLPNVAYFGFELCYCVCASIKLG